MKWKDNMSAQHVVFLRWCFVIAFAVSIGLFVGGFFVPPMGQIDGSVLKAGGILLLSTDLFSFAVLLPEMIRSKTAAALKVGKATIEINGGAAPDCAEPQQIE